MAWRELLAVIAEDDDLDDDLLDRPDDLLGAIADHAEVLERLGYSVRDALRDVGGPAELAGQLAEMLGISEEEALVNAIVREADDEDEG